MDRGLINNILSALCNAVSAALVAVAMLEFYSAKGGRANMQVKKARCFEYFTVDSNLLAAAACIIMLVFNIIGFFTGEAIPEWAAILKFVGAAAVGVTFFVVMLLLAPYAGYAHMLEGGSLHLHLIVPVLCMASCILFDGGGRLPLFAVWLALIPVVIYGCVYFRMVVIKGPEKGGWEDFYGFNKGGRWYLSVVMMAVMTLAIAFLIRLGHNAFFPA
ncbi:MAG: Pr6Pr family membrane protein [Clostridia bacterium]|jgi:hypothetical protein|nr:Pr6Pr family membrane protein [Clostridia bacterium]MBR3487596.1 Pr6Pr family membrane protein [Clostridia bacterium]